MKGESHSISTNIQNPVGHLTLTDTQIKLFDLYTTEELQLATQAWPAVLRYVRLLSSTPTGSQDLFLEFRLQRHRAWLEAALATFFSNASTESICRYWTERADDIVRRAWASCDLHTKNYALIAMGKLGAQELNLSSDIDLIIVRSDGEGADLKAVHRFNQILSDVTEFGFCFRLDYDLRPGGRSAPLLPSISEYENYLGYHGQLWERLALVRFRPLAGPEQLIQQIQTFTQKWAFRSYLDYTVIQEMKLLRDLNRNENPPMRPGHFHLKLGKGGIRELELYVHSLQVMYGGKKPNFRTNSTTQAIHQLQQAGILTDGQAVYELYWKLRDIENRLHAYHDEHTYDVVMSPDLKVITEQIDTITSDFFISPKTTTRFTLDEVPQILRTAGMDPSGPVEKLSDEFETTWNDILLTTSVTKGLLEEENRQKFLLSYVDKILQIKGDLGLALQNLLDFMRATRAKASFFALLASEPPLVNQLAHLFSFSPYLAGIVCRRPEIMDEILSTQQASPSQDFEIFLEDLADRKVLVEILSASHLLSGLDINLLQQNISSTADEIALLLLDRIAKKNQFDVTKLSILALGKWGGREMGLRSDLDFVFVVAEDVDHQAVSKVTRQFIQHMIAPRRGGNIFSIDMRLRPTGSAGPIMVTAGQLANYLLNSSQVWERQAYLRARTVGSSAGIDAVQGLVQKSILRPLMKKDYDLLNDIKKQLLKPSTEGEFDFKYQPGGLIDIELGVQTALLAQTTERIYPTSTREMIEILQQTSDEWACCGGDLLNSYEYLRLQEQLAQLCQNWTGSKVRLGTTEFDRLAGVNGIDKQLYISKLNSVFLESERILASLSASGR